MSAVTLSPTLLTKYPSLQSSPAHSSFLNFGNFLNTSRADTLFNICTACAGGMSGRYLNKYVHMVFHDFHRIYPELILFRNPLKHLFQIFRNFPTQYVFPVLGYPYQMILQIIYGMLCPSNPHAVVIQEKALLRQAPLPRLTASHFPPASKLAGIQWSFL